LKIECDSWSVTINISKLKIKTWEKIFLDLRHTPWSII
jgi:hypothetical protein